MRLIDVYSAKALAAYFTHAHSNDRPYLGLTLFPRKKKMGLDLKWIKGYKGLPVPLNPSAFDTKSKGRGKLKMQDVSTQMPYFKEHVMVDEEDEQEILRVTEAGDPYAQQVLDHIYTKADDLIISADVVAERMIWMLLAAENGKPGIDITANGASYQYDYDESGEYKAEHFVELTGTDMWSDHENCDPIADAQMVIDKALAKGVILKAMVISPKTMSNLVKSKKIASYILAQNSTANIYMNKARVKEVFKNELNIEVIVYEKLFKDYDGKDKAYYPDTMATFLPEGALGNLWYGTSPIERKALGSKDANVSQVNTGVNIMVTQEHDPENTKTVVDEIVLPSFECMDSVYLLKHSA